MRPFGDWLADYMRSQSPPIERPELARRSGIDAATLSRWIRNESRPTPDKLRLVAPALRIDYSQLLSLAGYGAPTDAATVAVPVKETDPLAAELDRMLDQNSPLGEERRQRLRLIVDQVMEPERKLMRRRRSA
jgi:transcriptional regulator with XRE-family HTH domain